MTHCARYLSLGRLALVVGGLSLAWLSGCAKPRPTADQVLAGMAQAYGDLNTLRERVEARVRVTGEGQTTAAADLSLQLDWTFARPNKLHYQASRYRPVTVVSDGKQVYTVLPEALEAIVTKPPEKVTDLPSLNYATAGVVGINEFKLLEGEDPRRLLDNVRLEPEDDRAAGVWCHVLSGDLREEEMRQVGVTSGTQRVWVGREDFLIRRYDVNVSRITERRALEARPGAEPDVLERRELARVVVVQLEPDVELKPDTFSYQLPDGYRVVRDLRGTPLPEITLPDLQGRPVSLARYRGKNLVLAFWASWDQESIAQLAIVQRFRDEHPGDDLVVLSATRDVVLPEAESWLRDQEVTLPTLQAGGDLDERIRDLDVLSLPKIFLIDKEGIIQGVISELVGVQDLEEAARAAGMEL